MEVRYKKMAAYAATDGKNIYINKAKNRSGMQMMDSIMHERNHITNPKLSERAIIEKTRKDRLATLAII